MVRSRRRDKISLLCSVVLPVVLVGLTASSAWAEVGGKRVSLIMEKLPPPASAPYKSIRKHAGKATGQVLTLTKTEMWSVPAENVEDLKKAAAQHGARASELGTHWNHVLQLAPADLAMTDSQKSMMEHARAAKATMGIGIVAAPGAPAVEYALTRHASTAATSSDLARITLALSQNTVVTVARTSVNVKADMCIWRGTVEGTGAPAMLMWWPGGKMAGTIQHEGRLYSIRHMGGEMHVVVETSEERMPGDHAPMPQRMREGTDARDDPLINQGEASRLKSKDKDKRD